MTALRMLRRGGIEGRQVCPVLPGWSRPRTRSALLVASGPSEGVHFNARRRAIR
jgi:hypothetical protein